MDGYEDKTRNPFYKNLRTRFNDVWSIAVKNNWFVCIPQRSSLRGEMNRKEFETHVLQPSKMYPGEFLTLNGRTVNIVGNEIVTKNGFAENRKVRIIYTEEYKDEQNEKMKCHLLHLGCPLEGGVDAPSGSEEMSRPVIQQFVALLKSYPEHESVFLRLNDFIKETKTYFNFEKGRPLHNRMENFVRHEMEYATATLLNSPCFYHLNKSARKKQSVQISQVLESYIMDGIHDVVFQWVKKEEEEHDLELTKILNGMMSWNQNDLDMQIEFQCPQDEAVNEFLKLSRCRTPLEKMLCLNTTHTLINRAVERNLTSRYLDIGAHQMTTDDLLDQLIFVIIAAAKQSRLKSDLAANIKYVQRFHLLNVNTTVLGYNQANLEVAIGWFLLKRRTVEKPLWAMNKTMGNSNDNINNNNNRNDNTINNIGNNSKNTTPSRRRRSRNNTPNSKNNTPKSKTNNLHDGTAGANSNERQNGVNNGDAAAGMHKTSGGIKKSNNKNGNIIFPSPDIPGEAYLLGKSGLMTAEEERKSSPLISQCAGEAQQLECGGQFFVKLDSKGYVWTWGVPNCGRLGWHGIDKRKQKLLDDEKQNHSPTYLTSGFDSLSMNHAEEEYASNVVDTKPTLIPSLRSVYIVEISCGTHHTVVRARNGTLFAWGDNRSGQLGVGTTEHDTSHPIKVDLTSCTNPKMTSISCGSSHTLAISADGSIISWGKGGSGRLGTGNVADSGIPTIVNRTTDGYALGIATNVVGGWSHSIVILQTGHAYSWGCGADGRLGVGSYSDQRYPCKVVLFGDKPVKKKINNERSNNLSPSSFEHVEDMFGTPTTSDAYNQPAYALSEREQPLDIKIGRVAAGYSHTIFLTVKGTVFATGSGVSGQLGIVDINGNNESICVVPRPIHLNQIVIDVACGDHHSALLTNDGKLLTWGLNKTNACGLNFKKKLKNEGGANMRNEDKIIPLEQFSPVESIVFTNANKKPMRLSAGSDTTIIIVEKV